MVIKTLLNIADYELHSPTMNESFQGMSLLTNFDNKIWLSLQACFSVIDVVAIVVFFLSLYL